VFGDYQSTDPSRFIDEIPAGLVEEVPSAFLAPQQSFSPFRGTSYGKGSGYRGRSREESAVYAYEDEDQSVPSGLKPGLRVRHPAFGVGTIVSVEPLDGDTKLIVRFASVGQKTLRAKFAKLEVA
jgi:DNA helicase-2/ATP-dependent DNA helicase PcrA